MNNIELTWWRVTKIYWAIIWRTFLFSFIIIIPVTFLFGMISAAFGVTEQITPYFQFIAGLIGIPVAIWATRTALLKQYSDFRIVFLPSLESLLVNESQGQNSRGD